MWKQEGERQSKSCEIERVKERERKCERERENVIVQLMYSKNHVICINESCGTYE